MMELPDDLPVPVDDGAADHLPGLSPPDVELPSTDGGSVRLADLGDAVLFCYPSTGRPGVEPLGGSEAWDRIPGARGCTPQVCSYRDSYSALSDAGYDVFGMSIQDTDDQREAAERLNLPFPLLSDRDLRAANALRLPTFEVEGVTLLKRLTLIARGGRIAHVRYPVFPPDADAEAVLGWITEHTGGAAP